MSRQKDHSKPRKRTTLLTKETVKEREQRYDIAVRKEGRFVASFYWERKEEEGMVARSI